MVDGWEVDNFSSWVLNRFYPVMTPKVCTEVRQFFDNWFFEICILSGTYKNQISIRSHTSVVIVEGFRWGVRDLVCVHRELIVKSQNRNVLLKWHHHISKYKYIQVRKAGSSPTKTPRGCRDQNAGPDPGWLVAAWGSKKIIRHCQKNCPLRPI